MTTTCISKPPPTAATPDPTRTLGCGAVAPVNRGLEFRRTRTLSPRNEPLHNSVGPWMNGDVSNVDLIGIAAMQGGVVTRAQAMDHGHTRHTIDRELRSGSWGRVSKGVYRLIPAVDVDDRLLGAVTTLPDAVVSHTSAARLLGVDGLPDLGPSVTVVGTTTHRFDGVVVHRAGVGVAADHRTVVRRMPTTTVARTLVDLAGVVFPAVWHEVIQTAVVGGLTSMREVRAVAELVCGRGRAGSALMREFLGNPMAGASALERRVAVVLEPLHPVRQFPAPWDGVRRLDFAFPQARLGVEADGRKWHSTGRSFQSDRARDHAALDAGWLLVRLTHADVHRDPDRILRMVARLVRERTGG